MGLDSIEQMVISAVDQDDSNIAIQPLARFITVKVLAAIYSILTSMSDAALKGRPRMRTLARVVAMATAGRVPPWEDAELPGQRMYDRITRFKQQSSRASAAHRERLRKLRRKGAELPQVCEEQEALDVELFHCRYGCTPAMVPRRLAPPGLYTQPVKHEVCSLAEENLILRERVNQLSQKETDAVANLKSIFEETERDLLGALSTHAAVASAARSLCHLQAEVQVQAVEEAITIEQKLAQEHVSSKKLRAEVNELKGKALHLEGKLVSAHVDASRSAQNAQKHIEQLTYHHEAAVSECNSMRALKNKALKQNRVLMRAAQAKAETSGKRLKTAQEATEELKAVQAECDELHEEIDLLREYGETARKVKEAVTCYSEGGRIAPYPPKLRRLLYGWLLRRTPPSAIGANLVEAAALLAPGLEVAVPSEKLLCAMRQEATLVGEAISCLRVASCKRVVSFGFDDTTKMGDGLASTNLQIEFVNGEICDEVMRGAFLITSGTAKGIASAIESKVFARGRRLLEAVRTIYEKHQGEGSWDAADLPRPMQLGYHLLAKALIMSDTCNAARAAKRVIIERAGEEVKKLAGPVWDQMSGQEQNDATRAYVGDCMQHLRNILIDSMANCATTMMKGELEESLEAFSAYDRMSTDVMQLIRAVYKEFHHEGEYAKGKGKEFTHWLRQHHAAAFFLPFERAAGSRQDLTLDGAIPIFCNHVLCCTYLRDLVFVPGHKNVLEDFLWHSLSCVEMLALARVMTLFALTVFHPLRWLCGSSSQLRDWSVYSMGGVLDLVEQFLDRVAVNGDVLLDPAEDVFATIAADQPAFQQWREAVQAETILAPDGKTSHVWHNKLLAEARSPQNESLKQTTDVTIQLAMAMAAAGLQKMRDPKVAISDWLSSQDGQYSLVHSADMHAATVGAHTTNDRVESNFGCFDNVIRVFRTISVDAASGIAQSMRMHYLDPPEVKQKPSINRKRKLPSGPQSSAVGCFDRMPAPVQHAIVEMARTHAKLARQWERQDRFDQAKYREFMRAQNLQLQVEGLAEKGSLAIERFASYETRAVKDATRMKDALQKMSTMAEKLRFVREQVEMRTLGFGWNELAVPWKRGDESPQHSFERLLAHLVEKVLPKELAIRRAGGKLPEEAPMPDVHGRVLIADSWFGQVLCALELFRRGIYCIMNVKTATRGYPKAQILPHVAEIKGGSEAQRMARRARRGNSVAFEKDFAVGSKKVTLTAAGNNKKVPLLLIASASSMLPGEEHVKTWTTVNANAEVQTHELRTKQPQMHALYRKYMNLVDLHNKLRTGERSMSEAWRTHSWSSRHFAEALGFIEVNIFKSLQHFKKGIWAKMGHGEFRRRLAHAFMTLGKEPFPDDLVHVAGSVSSNTSFMSPPSGGTQVSDMSAESASGLFTGPGVQHEFVSYNKEKRELHTCAYCGNRTMKYCHTCNELGRGRIAVCGRKSGRPCIDDHAVGRPLKHGSYKLPISKDNGAEDAERVPETRAKRRRRCNNAEEASASADEQ